MGFFLSYLSHSCKSTMTVGWKLLMMDQWKSIRNPIRMCFCFSCYSESLMWFLFPLLYLGRNLPGCFHQEPKAPLYHVSGFIYSLRLLGEPPDLYSFHLFFKVTRGASWFIQRAPFLEPQKAYDFSCCSFSATWAHVWRWMYEKMMPIQRLKTSISATWRNSQQENRSWRHG